MKESEITNQIEQLEKELNELKAEVNRPELPKNLNDVIDMLDEEETVNGYHPGVIAFTNLLNLTKALNKTNKLKGDKRWVPVFNLEGFVFTLSSAAASSTSALIGSRLFWLNSKELADYAGKHFEELYMTYLLGIKS